MHEALRHSDRENKSEVPRTETAATVINNSSPSSLLSYDTSLFHSASAVASLPSRLPSLLPGDPMGLGVVTVLTVGGPVKSELTSPHTPLDLPVSSPGAEREEFW